MRDLVLLSGPDDDMVPRQGTRLALNERGHVISGCRFTKSQSMIEVERTIIQAFDKKIPPGVDIKLLISIHSTLVVLSLAPGQCGIDGTMLQRLYRNKPVYIRPNQQLLDLASHGIVQQVFYNIFSYVSINSMGAQPLPPPRRLLGFCHFGETTLQMPHYGVQIMQQNPQGLTLMQMPHPWGTKYKFSEDF
jgi:hypothetical protein